MKQLNENILKRRTFAIISHPDAGKTTITEKLLLHGGAIQMAGTVKGRKSGRLATSDWMKMEQERGISITTSVMQFNYKNRVVNLLDTPGHEDFSEDTYRTLTATDSALMVVDCAKGVEARTIKLMDVCRMRDTPVFSFVNKMDREGRDPVEILDEIESVLKISCAPITWPISMGRNFKGIYNLYTDTIYPYISGQGQSRDASTGQPIKNIKSQKAKDFLDKDYEIFVEEMEFVREAGNKFCLDDYLSGEMTPVFFGTALGNFGVKEMLDYFVKWAPAPLSRKTTSREIPPNEKNFSGFVFKIQANMDPKHRDRIAFMRICSGNYTKGMKMRHVRTGKDVKVTDALMFLAGDRSHVEEAYSGDIIGLHNHGTIQIGDTFTLNENLNFIGIPNFAPELFKRVRLKNPLKLKQLKKGLQQLSEEGATQIFMPVSNNDLILGAVGTLQFDVVFRRLQDEYGVEAVFEPINVHTACWIYCDNPQKLEDFKKKNQPNLAVDGGGYLSYMAPTRVNLSLTQERWPDITFKTTREYYS